MKGDSMKKLTSLIFLSMVLFIAGCAGQGPDGKMQTTLGNGVFDPVEQAALDVAVGGAFMARPELIPLSYEVAKDLLLIIPSDDTATVQPTLIDSLIKDQLVKRGVDPLLQESFMDLVTLVKANIVQVVGVLPDNSPQRRVILRQVIERIKVDAGRRMGIIDEKNGV